MLQDVLVTKLHIPIPRTQPIHRPRLFTKLDDGLYGKLTVVTAPAGFGKSTLVSDWAKSHPYPTAWLSLDEADSEPSRFLLHFIAAVQLIQPDFGEIVSSSLYGSELLSCETLFAAMINDMMHFENNIILVLDDYYCIESMTIDRGLSYFVEHLPSHIHLIIVSRAEPGLPLSRMRARDELTEIRATDLRFLGEEVQQFFDTTTQLSLSERNTTSIGKRTEGWAAGLQLAALAMKHTEDIDEFIQTFSGSHRYVMDYLTDEVLQQLSDDETSFLLQTSILDEMCAELCDALLGRHDSQQQLEHFEAMNLFIIPLDSQRKWYRYHHLFANLLQLRLTNNPIIDLMSLHQRAANWHDNKGNIDVAIKHYNQAQDIDGMVKIIRQNVRQNVMIGRINRVRNWLNVLPEERKHSNHYLARWMGWMYYFQQQPDQSAIWANTARTALEKTSFLSTEDYNNELASILGLQSWVARHNDNLGAAIELAEQALAILPSEPPGTRGMTYVFLADALAKDGQVDEAIEAYDESIRHNESIQNWLAVTGVIGTVASLLSSQGQIKIALLRLNTVIDKVNAIGQIKSSSNPRIRRLAIWYELNDLEAIQNDLDKVWDLIQFDTTKSTAPYHLLAAQFQLAQGNQDPAKTAIAKCEQDIQSWTTPYDKRRMVARIMRMHIQLDHSYHVHDWLNRVSIDFDQLTPLLIDEYIAYCDSLRFLNTPQLREDGLALVAMLHELCDDANYDGYRLIIYCLEALFLAGRGDSLTALTPLRHALTFAQEQGYIRTFVDFGQEMAHLLYEASARNIVADYAGFLLAQFPLVENTKVTRQQAQDLIEPLSDREIEILTLLAEGLSNQEIANHLFLSLGTIKVHNRNIFGKLSVKSRTQAVAKGRQLGILDDLKS